MWSFWEKHLRSHGDKKFVDMIIGGLRGGFRIGFQRNKVSLQSAKKNMASENAHQDVVSAYLDQELKSDRIALVGSQELAQRLGVHVSPFGVIPKKGKPNKWRLILDLSSPAERSVNDGISKEDCSLQYASVSEVAAKIVELGPWYADGKDGHSTGIPKYSGRSRRSTLLGNEVAG